MNHLLFDKKTKEGLVPCKLYIPKMFEGNQFTLLLDVSLTKLIFTAILKILLLKGQATLKQVKF